MTNVPGTSPERPIISSRGRPATQSRRRPVDVPISNFCIFVFPVKNTKDPLKVPWRSRTLGSLGELQGTSPGRRVPAGYKCYI